MQVVWNDDGPEPSAPWGPHAPKVAVKATRKDHVALAHREGWVRQQVLKLAAAHDAACEARRVRRPLTFG